jgi:hypothetical protein
MIPLLTEAANTKERWPERIDGEAAMGDGFGSTGIDEIEGEIGGSHPPINSTLKWYNRSGSTPMEAPPPYPDAS